MLVSIWAQRVNSNYVQSETHKELKRVTRVRCS